MTFMLCCEVLPPSSMRTAFDLALNPAMTWSAVVLVGFVCSVQCVMCIKEAISGSPPVIRLDWEQCTVEERSLCTSLLCVVYNISSNNSPLQLVAVDHIGIAVVVGTKDNKKWQRKFRRRKIRKRSKRKKCWENQVENMFRQNSSLGDKLNQGKQSIRI